MGRLNEWIHSFVGIIPMKRHHLIEKILDKLNGMEMKRNKISASIRSLIIIIITFLSEEWNQHGKLTRFFLRLRIGLAAFYPWRNMIHTVYYTVSLIKHIRYTKIQHNSDLFLVNGADVHLLPFGIMTGNWAWIFRFSWENKIVIFLPLIEETSKQTNT